MVAQKAEKDESFKENTEKRFSKLATGRSALCGWYIAKDSMDKEEASSSCCNDSRRL